MVAVGLLVGDRADGADDVAVLTDERVLELFIGLGHAVPGGQKCSPSKITSSAVLNEGVAVIFLAGFRGGRCGKLQLRSPPPHGSNAPG